MDDRIEGELFLRADLYEQVRAVVRKHRLPYNPTRCSNALIDSFIEMAANRFITATSCSGERCMGLAGQVTFAAYPDLASALSVEGILEQRQGHYWVVNVADWVTFDEDVAINWPVASFEEEDGTLGERFDPPHNPR
ncbi:MAG: hypothetical protein ACPHJ3_04800 [Rubripirellula sp.]